MFLPRWKKLVLGGLIFLLPLFAVVHAVFSATSSTDGSSTISANYPTPPPPVGGGDTVPPAAIINLTVSTSTASSATLTWTSTGDDGNDGLSNRYMIRYSTVGPITEANWLSATIASDPPTPRPAGAQESKAISGLSPDTTYYFAIKAADETPNWSAISNSPSAKTGVGPDVTAPVIRNIQTTIGQPNVWPGLRSVNIGWEVAEASGTVTSTVYLGKTTSYELETKSNFYSSPGGSVFGFNFVFSGLDVNITYHFKITAVDGSGNQSETQDQTFIISWDDVAPIISDIAVEPHINYAVVRWNTDEPADSQAAYGPTVGLGQIVSAAGLVTSHSLTIPNLLPNTKYYFVIRSADANSNQSSGDGQEFTTMPDVAPPANVGNFRAIPGDGKINLYWENPSDPDFAGAMVRRSSIEQPRDKTQGALIYRGAGSSFEDAGLANGVTYYYTAFSYDTSDNYSSGALASATPQAGEAPPPPPPPPPGCVGELCDITITTTSTISGFTLSDVDFFTARRSLRVTPQDGRVRILVGQDLTVSIRPQVFVKDFQNLFLRIGGFFYQFALDRFGNYSVDVTLPNQPAEYASAISFAYVDNGGRVENLNFAVVVVPGGLVFTVRDGERQVVEGATVELYFLNAGGGWELWNASGYRQANPQITNSGGGFGFAAPPGMYYLRVFKKGFHTIETGRFAVTNIIVDNVIELAAVPPPLEEVIKPEAPLVENARNVAKNLGQKTVYVSKVARQEIRKVITNPEVKKAAEQVAAPAVAAAAAVGTTAAVGFSQFLMYLRFLFTQPILVLFRRRRKGWGVVYNSLTKRPVDLVIVRLIDAVTGRIAQSRVTDKDGRYAFIAAPGRYKLEINQPQFVFPTHFLLSFKDDGAFVDIYHGEVIEVKEKGALITANVPLDPVGAERPVGRLLRQLFLRRVQSAVSIISLVLAVGFLLITPGILTAVLLAVQVIFFALFRHLAVPPKPKSWGIVYDEKTKSPLGVVIARIFDKQYNKLLETQVTDKRGRYSFLVGRNEYYITYERGGYEKRQTEPVNLKESAEASTVLAPDTELKPIGQELRTK